MPGACETAVPEESLPVTQELQITCNLSYYKKGKGLGHPPHTHIAGMSVYMYTCICMYICAHTHIYHNIYMIYGFNLSDFFLAVASNVLSKSGFPAPSRGMWGFASISFPLSLSPSYAPWQEGESIQKPSEEEISCVPFHLPFLWWGIPSLLYFWAFCFKVFPTIHN